MSNIAPDLPELRDVPEVIRPFAYLGALDRAIRSPATLLTGLVVFALTVGAGVVLGARWYGVVGAILGAVLGGAVAISFFFKALLPWRARRLLPSVLRDADWGALKDAQPAVDRITRGIAAYKERELGTDQTTKGPPGSQLP